MCVAKPIMLNNEKSYWVGARVVLIRSVMAENCSAGTYEKKSRQASGGSGRPAGQRAGRGGVQTAVNVHLFKSALPIQMVRFPFQVQQGRDRLCSLPIETTSISMREVVLAGTRTNLSNRQKLSRTSTPTKKPITRDVYGTGRGEVRVVCRSRTTTSLQQENRERTPVRLRLVPDAEEAG